MPSLWEMPVPGGVIDRRQLHGLLASCLDTDHHADRKGWSWKATTTGIEIGVLDDGLVGRLLTGAGRRVRQVAAVAWSDVAGGSGRAWAVEFVSPVTFRRGNRLLPWPSPSAVLGSLRADWRRFAAPHAGDLEVDLAFDPVVVTEVRGASEVERFVLHERPDAAGKRVPVQVTVGGFRGRVTYAVEDPGLRDAVGKLLAIAPYAGVGAHTTRGFGGVRLHPGR
ncbi:CRISPR system precrRNA processing endoribonuclease RAMP protein Cas6 [Amycolatopsis sp. NPDC003731]